MVGRTASGNAGLFPGLRLFLVRRLCALLGRASLLGLRLLALGLVRRQHLFLDDLDRAAGLLDRGLGRGRGVVDRQRKLGLELPGAEQAQTVLAAAQETR